MYPGFESQSIRKLIQELAVWYNDNVIYPDKSAIESLLPEALFLYKGHRNDFRYCAR